MTTMTRGIASMAMVLVCAAVAAAQTSSPGSSPAGDAVRALETKRYEAMKKGDVAALEQLLADDLVYVHSSGNVDTKQQFIETLRSGKLRYKELTPSKLDVRVFENTAIIHGRAKFVVEREGQSNLESDLSYLDVWRRRNGKWQMVAWQSARLPQ